MTVRTKGRRGLALAATAVAGAMLLAACGGSSGGGSGGGNANSDHGPITYVQGKDNSNVAAPIVAKWNAAHPTEKVTLKEQTDAADQQHDDDVQHFQAKDPSYDVISVDVVWTAEFAAKGWLQTLTGQYALPTDGFLEPPVKAATYNGKLVAAPASSDGGMLYYRSDLVKTPPKTLDEMWADCSIAKSHNMDCYAGQFTKYEGLTCNATEAINTFGGAVVGADGVTATVDSPQAKQGLQMLADHYKSGDIPKQAITYQEEQGRQSFEAGKLLFLRNWPYVYNLATTDASSKVKGKFAVAPLPGVSGPGASTLGGHSLGMSVYSKHKGTALDFMKFFTSPDIQKFLVVQASNAPILTALYDDPELVKKLPYLTTLKTAIENAVPRPVSPFYPAVTKAIEDNSYAAIKGDKSVDQALKDMQAAITAASAGS
jgi:multiple sugar transport system substrate-binding protein